jgi:hypothetical protein
MIMKACVGCVYEYDWAEPLTAVPEGCKGCKMVNGKPTNYISKPQTNADRIRAMSDEELADFLRLDGCHKIKGDNRICNGWCDECVLEWLKQPAEED